jgi:phosphate-selective porin
MMKKKMITLLALSSLVSGGFAQADEKATRLGNVTPQTETREQSVEERHKLKTSGYIQTQFQYGERAASLKVGAPNGDSEQHFNRIGIRRGRIKFSYEQGVISGAFQLDITEKGVGIKDAYLNMNDPWWGNCSLRAGVFNRPFGYEISYSSSLRESPERSVIFQTLFPDERDLGAMLTLRPPRSSALHLLKIEAGLFAGNGIKQETDNRKDFIGHLSAVKNIGSRIHCGLGASYYNGSVRQGTENVYRTHHNGFTPDSRPANKGRFAKREYVGFDARFSLTSPLGTSQLRGEYLFGTQPADASGSKSPNASSSASSDTYIRSFVGGYIMLVQEVGRLPLSAVVKYDRYDPNTSVSGNDIGQRHTGKGDVAYSTLGAGLIWQLNGSVRLQAYYEAVSNEQSERLTGYEEDLKDDVFTFRLQYQF